MLPDAVRPQENVPPKIFIGPSKILVQFFVRFQSFTEKKLFASIVCHAAVSLVYFPWVLLSVPICFELLSNITRHTVKK